MKLIKALIITWAFAAQAGLPPTTLSGQSSATKPTTFGTQVPYSQATSLGGINSLIETGSENMLLNPNFEAPTLSGWTCTTGTCTVESTIFSSGKQSAKIVPAANIFDFSQQISTPANIQRQGVMGLIYNFPATCTTASVQTIVDGTVQSTVPTTSLILDGAFHSIEIPITFGATSAKIRAFSTASCTGNIYIDKAYISQGIGYQNLMLDNVYSAQSSSAGVISAENTEFITGNCIISNTSTYTCPISKFITTPNCTCTGVGISVAVAHTCKIINSTSSTSLVYQMTYGDSSTGITQLVPAAASISCQKSSTDYLASSANVYSQASANYSRRAYTPTLVGYGTSPSSDCYESREGEINVIDCKITVGTAPPASVATVSLPSGNVSQAFTSIRMVGQMDAASIGVVTQQVGAAYSMLSSPSTSVLNYGYRNSGSGGLVARNGNGLTAGDVLSFTARVPISGWSNSNVIVGSFAGVPAVPGYQGNVDTFSLHYAGAASQSAVCAISPCTIYNQIGNAVSSITRSGSGNNTMFFAKTYAKINCSITSGNNGSSIINTYTAVTAANAPSLNFITMNGLAVGTDGFGTIMCQGSY